MNIRKQFKRRVIELIHDLPYEEAIEKERPSINPITIGRVMQAIGDNPNLIFYLRNYGYRDTYIECWEQIEKYTQTMIFKWKLIKENGQECDDSDQSDETIEQLFNLIKKP